MSADSAMGLRQALAVVHVFLFALVFHGNFLCNALARRLAVS